jgi:CRISPR/Cas system-associated exonuclease Cas4 (RecB family)
MLKDRREIEAMTLQAWCEEHKLEYKVILTDSISNVNSLKRQVSRHCIVANLRGCRMVDIAREIIIQHEAEEGHLVKVTEADNKTAALLVLQLLNNDDTGRYSFVPKECICMETAEEISRVIQVVRSGKIKLDVAAEGTEQEKQFMTLLHDYEAKLSELNLYDENRMLTTAIAYLKETECKPDYLVGILSYMRPYLTYVETEFLNLLSSDITDIDTAAVEQAQISVTCYKSYGQTNEIQQVIRDIQDKQMPYGNVNIMVSSAQYDNIIKAALKESGIPFRFISSYSLRDKAYVSLLLSIITWARKDFNYGDFRNVAGNMLVHMSRDYNKVRKLNIGWGLDRYLMFADKMKHDRDNYTELLLKHKKIYQKTNDDGTVEPPYVCDDTYVEFIDGLAKVFADLNSGRYNIGIIYRKLTGFLREYVEINNMEKPYRTMVEHMRTYFDYAGEVSSLDEALSFIYDNLSDISGTDEEISNAVTIMGMGKVAVLTRPYQYCIGMSYDSFEPKVVDSPVISDERILEILDEHAGYIPLKTMQGKEKKDMLVKTLDTIPAGSVSLITCDFDTINLREITASSAYVELKNKYGITEENNIGYPNLKDLNNTYKIDKKKLYENTENAVGEADNEKTDILQDIGEQQSNSEGNMKPFAKEEIVNGHRLIHLENLSPTSIHYLMMCPLIYEYKQQYFNEEPAEKNVSIWLPPADKGNFFHQVFQEYCDSKLTGHNIAADEVVDEKVLQSIYKNTLEEFEILVPKGSEQAYNMEKEEFYIQIKTYLDNLYTEFKASTEKWSVWNCEYEFNTPPVYICEAGILSEDEIENVILNSEGKEVPDISEDTIVLSFHGFMDRVDVGIADADPADDGNIKQDRDTATSQNEKTDKNGPLVYRIIDYKTGKKERLQNKIEKENTQIQHAVYPKGLAGVVKEFSYDFPCDDNEKLVMTGNSISHIPDIYIERLKAVFIRKSIKDILSVQDKQQCSMCEYSDICAYRMNLRIQGGSDDNK